MKTVFILVICVAVAALGGCTDPDRYPISGQDCSPDDTVQDLDTSDCVPAI